MLFLKDFHMGRGLVDSPDWQLCLECDETVPPKVIRCNACTVAYLNENHPAPPGHWEALVYEVV